MQPARPTVNITSYLHTSVQSTHFSGRNQTSISELLPGARVQGRRLIFNVDQIGSIEFEKDGKVVSNIGYNLAGKGGNVSVCTDEGEQRVILCAFPDSNTGIIVGGHGPLKKVSLFSDEKGGGIRLEDGTGRVVLQPDTSKENPLKISRINFSV